MCSPGQSLQLLLLLRTALHPFPPLAVPASTFYQVSASMTLPPGSPLGLPLCTILAHWAPWDRGLFADSSIRLMDIETARFIAFIPKEPGMKRQCRPPSPSQACPGMPFPNPEYCHSRKLPYRLKSAFTHISPSQSEESGIAQEQKRRVRRSATREDSRTRQTSFQILASLVST